MVIFMPVTTYSGNKKAPEGAFHGNLGKKAFPAPEIKLLMQTQFRQNYYHFQINLN